MAHRALTLKYRPQVFADLIGQDHVTLVLGRALENHRVAHAYLFTGARGVGKTTSARILAKALNCERRASGQQQGPDPCNACTSCTEITAGVSLDVAEIDGASNRGIADVQALREKVRFAPTGGRHRIVIIDEVHQLSNDAFAALLKTLEEPPAHLVFIFATTDPQKLPDTIRSRTQRFDFARVPLRKVADRLLDIREREAKDKDGVRFTLSEGAALLLAHKSEGSMRDAVSALDQVVSSGEPDIDDALVRRVMGIADHEAFFGIAGAIVARDPKGALHAVNAAFDKGIDPRDLAEGLAEHIRHILVLKLDPQGGDLVALAKEDLARLKSQGEGWTEGDLLRLLKIVSECTFPMRDSAQPMLHLEAAVAQMATLEPGELLAEVLARLQALEQRMGGTPAPTGGAARTPAATGSRGGASGGSTRSLGAMAAAVPATAPGVSAAGAPVTTATATSIATPAIPESAVSAPAALDDSSLLVDSDAERAWKRAVTAINGRKRMLGAFLEESRFLGATADDLLLGMDDLHRAVVEEKDNRALLAEEVQRAFGRVLVVRCVSGDASAVPRPLANADVRPMVDQAIDWFKGEAVQPRRGTERTNG